MAATIKQLKDFIESYPPNWHVWVGDGGQTLVVASPNKAVVNTCEIGGEPKPENA